MADFICSPGTMDDFSIWKTRWYINNVLNKILVSMVFDQVNKLDTIWFHHYLHCQMQAMEQDSAFCYIREEDSIKTPIAEALARPLFSLTSDPSQH